jgi:hypothetical protein
MQRWAVNKQLGQIANQQVCRLTKSVRFTTLSHIWQWADLQFSNNYFCDVRICDKETQFFKDIKLLQMHNYAPYQYRHKKL